MITHHEGVMIHRFKGMMIHREEYNSKGLKNFLFLFILLVNSHDIMYYDYFLYSIKYNYSNIYIQSLYQLLVKRKF